MSATCGCAAALAAACCPRLATRPTRGLAPTVTTDTTVSDDVVDVTGAGDSMTAGFVHALLRDDDPVAAAAFGQATAALTTESAHTVRPDLTHALVTGRLTTQQGTA